MMVFDTPLKMMFQAPLCFILGVGLLCVRVKEEFFQEEFFYRVSYKGAKC